jgi:dUTP pyrophosphatase
MKIKFKKLSEDAVSPTRAKPGDAGADLTATSMNHYPDYTEYGTSIAVELPEGHVGLVFPRSSVSGKELILANSVGVIDEQYRGEIKLRFKRTKDGAKQYLPGERVGQLVIVPFVAAEYEEAEELSETERGEGSFGSSGV